MLRILHYEPCVERGCYPAHSKKPSLQPPWPVQTALLGIFGGLLGILDGLAAYRHFEQLQSHGVARDTALKRALGIRASHEAP
jgi:hypothetical protein